jgi:hypothetical protein
MFDYFRFSLPRAVTEQLIEKLGTMAHGALTEGALGRLVELQRTWKTRSGVYIIYHKGKAVYVGKANKLAERLKQHRRKLSGRQCIILSELGFKALLLDENWSTSTNEELLIEHFKKDGEAEWNNGGFGPKDPGRNRDGSEPSVFDLAYPIREDFPVTDLANETTVIEALLCLKKQLPFLLRYDKRAKENRDKISFAKVPRNTKAVCIHIAKSLGDDWQLMLFKSHLTLYRTNKAFEHGERLHP